MFFCILNVCKSENNNFTLQNLLKKGVSKSDIQNLEEILSFYDDLIVKHSNLSSIDTGYYKYMENLSTYSSLMELIVAMQKDKNKVDSIIDNYKNRDIFYKIWKKTELRQISTGLTKEELIINIDDLYLILIDNAIEVSPVLNDYKRILVTTGGNISPSIIAGFQSLRDQVNLQSEIIRLIISIHYITLISSSEY